MIEYKTVNKSACDEFIERKSKFIGYCQPVETEEEAVEFINTIKSKHWNATHNVYAYVLNDGKIMRYSDDGEPQGTAGIPVLDVIKKTGLTNTAVVVTRYFGGILLGAGGLVRAYSHGAKIAIESSGIIFVRECLNCEIICDYSSYGKINAFILEKFGVIDNTEFTDNVKIIFHLSELVLNDFQKELSDITAGKISVKVFSKQFYKFSS